MTRRPTGASFETPRFARLLRTRGFGRPRKRRCVRRGFLSPPARHDRPYVRRAWPEAKGARSRSTCWRRSRSTPPIAIARRRTGASSRALSSAMPLGRAEATGVVWAVRPGGGDNLKAIAATLDWPPLRAPLRDFIDWVARWTLSPRGMVLQDGDPRRRSRPAAGAEVRLRRDRQGAGAHDRGAGAGHGGGRGAQCADAESGAGGARRVLRGA